MINSSQKIFCKFANLHANKINGMCKNNCKILLMK